MQLIAIFLEQLPSLTASALFLPPLLLLLLFFTLYQIPSRIPGPLLTKYSVLPIIYQDHISNRTLWTDRLHRRYGPIVRLSPKEVSICSSGAIRDVFTGSAKNGYYSKAPIFNIFQHFGARNAFSSIREEEHGWRRKIVAGSYAMSTVVGKSGRIWGNVGEFVGLIEREGVRRKHGKGRAVDFFSACRFYAAENITAHLFVEGSRALQGDEDVRERIESSAEKPGDVMIYLRMEFEGLYSLIVGVKRVLGLETNTGRSRPALASGKKVEVEDDQWYGGTSIRDWGWKRFLSTREALVEGTIEATMNGPVAAKLAANAIEGESLPAASKPPRNDDAGIHYIQAKELRPYYRNQGCASECMDQFLAGLDTVGDTLAYALHLLSLPSNIAIQKTLQQECAKLALPSHISTRLSSTDLSSILSNPLLDAILKETLRAYPASTTALQRVVPSGGRTLDGYFVPGGSIVGATPVTVNRDISVFDRNGEFDVREWHPQRWLEADATSLAEMNRRLWTFGSGGRGCIGKHFAILEMKLLLAGVYSRYTTTIDNETPVPKPKKYVEYPELQC